MQCEVAKWGFDRCEVVKYKHCKAYVASNHQMVLLAFAGTNPFNLNNLMTDLQASLVPAGLLGRLSSFQSFFC